MLENLSTQHPTSFPGQLTGRLEPAADYFSRRSSSADNSPM